MPRKGTSHYKATKRIVTLGNEVHFVYEKDGNCCLTMCKKLIKNGVISEDHGGEVNCDKCRKMVLEETMLVADIKVKTEKVKLIGMRRNFRKRR